MFTEEGFLFSVDTETLYKSGITEGTILQESEVLLLKDQSDTRKAKDQALRWLSLRIYATKELYNKLCTKYDAETSAAAVELMEELGLLDDMEYAVQKAAGMIQHGKSRSEVLRKLNESGIPREIAQTALIEAGDSDEENALKLVNKMYIEKLRKGEKQKVMAALARRGFGHKAIQYAVETAMQQLDLNDEFYMEY